MKLCGAGRGRAAGPAATKPSGAAAISSVRRSSGRLAMPLSLAPCRKVSPAYSRGPRRRSHRVALLDRLVRRHDQAAQTTMPAAERQQRSASEPPRARFDSRPVVFSTSTSTLEHHVGDDEAERRPAGDEEEERGDFSPFFAVLRRSRMRSRPGTSPSPVAGASAPGQLPAAGEGVPTAPWHALFVAARCRGSLSVIAALPLRGDPDGGPSSRPMPTSQATRPSVTGPTRPRPAPPGLGSSLIPRCS